MRVYQLMEDVEALLALVGRRDPRRAPRKCEPSRRDFVEALLKEHGLASLLHLLRRFRERPLVKAAIEDRHRFVHSYRDEPDHDQLYGNALAVLAARVPTQTAAIQERMRWIVEADEIWGDLVSPDDRSADHEKRDRAADRQDRHE